MYLLAAAAAVLVCIAILVMFTGLGQAIRNMDSVKDRLGAFAPASAVGESAEEPAGHQPKKKTSRLAGVLNRSISRRSFAASVAADLARANLPLTVPEYILLNAALACVLFLLALALSRQVVLGLVGGVAGLILPRFYVGRRQSQRQAAFQQQLPDMLTLLVGSLRTGYGMTIAMDTVAKQMPSPTSEEFGRVVRETALGLSTSQALANLVRRIRSDDLDLAVTAINIQNEIGGNLATILETISATIRERVRLKGQLHTMTVQSTMTRYILTGLPFGLGLILFLMNPEYMGNLFTPGITLLIPIVAVVSVILGYIVMGKLSKIEI